MAQAGVSAWSWRSLKVRRGTVSYVNSLHKPRLQESQDRPSRGQAVQRSQGAKLVEDGPLESCNHGYAGGKGCYLCDPEHPYRKKESVT
jgi:hypothetical protein